MATAAASNYRITRTGQGTAEVHVANRFIAFLSSHVALDGTVLWHYEMEMMSWYSPTGFKTVRDAAEAALVAYGYSA